MEKQKLIYVESKALFSPSSVSNKAIVFIKDTKEIWTHGTYFICSNIWATPITLTLSGDSTGSVSIDGSGNVTLLVTNNFLTGKGSYSEANNAVEKSSYKLSYYPVFLNGSSNLFPSVNNANAILTLNTHDYTYNHQLGFSSNKGIYHRTRNAGTWETSWREILTSTNYTKYPHTFASLTNKPTTISGYGITDSIPIISGDIVTTDTDLSTLGMTTFGAKFSISRTNNVNTPSWGYGYSNYLIFRSTGDTYSGISTDFSSGMVTFIGGRNLETTANNVPNWWFRIKGASGTTYDLNSFLNIINNLDSNYLRKSGGTMTGLILMTRGASYLTDTGSGYSMLGMINSGTSTTGMNSEEGMFINVPFTLATLRTSGNNLWHYNHANSARYLILDANNYTNYTIPYAKANRNDGKVSVIYNNALYNHEAISCLLFFPPDNLAKVSYLLIAELSEYGTGVNTSYIDYVLSGAIYAYRGGNAAHSNSYNITIVVSIGPGTYSRIYTSSIIDAVIPMVVKYNSKYYIALKKNLGSSTNLYFIGIAKNLLSSYIGVTDESLIEFIKGPENTTSTHLYYYNAGTPKKYLHEGNYSNYTLPLKGGTLTGILRSTQVAGNLGTSPIVCTGNVTSAAGINNTYSHLASNLAASGVLQILIGKKASVYNAYSIGYLHRGDGSNTNAITLGLYGANNLLIVQGNGNVGIGNVSPSYKLSVNGDIYSSGYVRGNSGFIKTDSSDSYVLLGGGGHKLLSDLSSAHTHDWSSITSKPSLLGAMANPLFYPYANDSKLGAYISTINNRFYSADLRYTVTTTNLSGDKHLLFDDNYDQRMLMDPGTTATITIEGYNFVYNTGYIMLYFYYDGAYPLKFPKSITAKATVLSGTEYTLNRVTAVESGNTIAFLIGLEYLTKLEFTIVSQDDAYCGITNIDYFTRRTENTTRDCAVVTKYNANTLYHNLTAPKYIVKNGTSSLFLKADGSLDNTAYLSLSGGTMTGAINTANIYPKAHAGFNIGSTSNYYNTMYAYYFKKYGSDDNYLLLGGGGHKKISDFLQILDKGIEGGNGGNTDNWVLVLNNNYSTGWYGPCTMFYIRSKNFGCGILCFYHYWNTEGTSGYYDNSVWFFGAEHSAYSSTMGGTGRDINNYLKIYIDKENADLKIYYNRYNNLALNVQELLFVHGPSGTLYPSGELRASHFINSTQAVELPTTSNTFVNIPILTVKNHTEDIKTTRSVYASAFYENSDIRLKENVHSIDLIDLLKNVDLVLFNFKNDLNKKYGVIAQQLEQVGLNNLVYEHNGNKAVDYISLLVLETLRLRNEIKELKEKLDKKELSS